MVANVLASTAVLPAGARIDRLVMSEEAAELQNIEVPLSSQARSQAPGSNAPTATPESRASPSYPPKLLSSSSRLIAALSQSSRSQASRVEYSVGVAESAGLPLRSAASVSLP